MPCACIHHIGQDCNIPYKRRRMYTHAQKKKKNTTTLPSPRATRAKSIKRQVENEAEERRRRRKEEKEEEGGMKEWSDEAPTKDSLSHADARGRMEAIGMAGGGTTRGGMRVQRVVPSLGSCNCHLFYTGAATSSTDAGRSRLAPARRESLEDD